MATPVTVAALRERATRLFERDGRRWAVGEDASAVIDVPLHPPAERGVLADYGGAVAWVESWRAAQGANIEVLWESRRWGRVGIQAVPARARVTGAESVASVARVTAEWRQWCDRAAELTGALGDGVVAGTRDDLRAAIVTHLRAISALDPTDFQRLRDVCRWLRQHPVSGRYIRELPIRGIDSKWMERHRAVVEALVGGGGPGLRQPPALVRLRFLDPALTPAGLDDLTAPRTAVSGLDLRPQTVLIVENLQTFLALPSLEGTIAIDGHGDIAPTLAGIGWIGRARRLYWGDLDSHGLRILSKTRAAGLDVDSCLMDTGTLLAFRDLWVPEPAPFRGAPDNLTNAELATLALLRDEGNVRLEQERVAWEYALQRLRERIRAPG